jgi:hypothetical protein
MGAQPLRYVRGALQSRLTRSFALALVALASGCAGMQPAGAPEAALSRALRDGEIAARGVVFEDRDGDRERSAGEPGLSGVLISNGAELTRTDRLGRYAIPIDAADGSVFVIDPRGYRVPQDALARPRFAYLHRPSGSPAALAPGGIAPTGALPASIDFALVAVPEPERFDALLFGDPQPRTLRDLDFLARDTLAGLAGTSAAFGLALGDLVHDDLALLDPLDQLLATLGIPFYRAIGNHDLDFAAAGDADSDDSFERRYGPANYAFTYGPAHFIVLDDVDYHGAQRDGRAGGYEARLGRRTLDFLEAMLEAIPADELAVVAMHIPPDRLDPDEGRAFFGALSRHPLSLSLSGHTHLQEHRFFGAEAGFTAGEHHHLNVGTTSGGWWLGAEDESGIPNALMRCGAPKGYWILRVDGARYELDYRASRRPSDYQLQIHAPARARSEDAGRSEVAVNVFAGSPRDSVEMRLADGPWRALVREARPDPFYLEQGERETRWLPRERRLSPPANSPHLWVGKLPEHPARGTHLLEVRTTDSFGRSFSARRPIAID